MAGELGPWVSTFEDCQREFDDLRRVPRVGVPGSRWYVGTDPAAFSTVIRPGDYFLYSGVAEPQNSQYFENTGTPSTPAYTLRGDLSGATGATGTRGSKWFVGTDFNAAAITAVTLPGDFFMYGAGVLEPALGEVYENTGSVGAPAWTFRADISGPTGPAGPAGTTGPFVTSLPASPVDGQEVYYRTSNTIWHLKYDALAGAPYKWWFVGGAPLHAEGNTIDSQGHSGFLGSYDSVVNGANLTVPLSGDYNVGFGWVVQNTAGGGTCALTMFAGGTQVLTELITSPFAAGYYHDAYSICGANGIAAGSALTMRFTANVGGPWESRGKRASLFPIRVG